MATVKPGKSLGIARVPLYAIRLALPAAVVALCLMASGIPAASAAADVQVANLDCSSNPEVVELKNVGDQSQDMTGWKLVSDPVATETYNLAPLGTLAAGSSVFIESGPGAQATFTWSKNQIFRNGDSLDFVRLVDPSGNVRSQKACPAAQTTPSPTASPTPGVISPTPTTAPVPAVPNGGGPPGASNDQLVAPLTALIAGASLAGLGGAMFVGLWFTGVATLWRRTDVTSYELPPPPSPTGPRRPSHRAQAASEPMLIALAVAICAAVIVALLALSSERRK